LVAIHLAVITSALAVDHPVEPFQKVKALALTNGVKTDSGIYGIFVKEKGRIVYKPSTGFIQIMVGSSPKNNKVVFYIEKKEDGSIVPEEKRYWVGREIDGKKEATIVSWSVAWDVAVECLKELGL
jgi:hypothetical protein